VLEELGVSPPGQRVSPPGKGELNVTSRVVEEIDISTEEEVEEEELGISPSEMSLGLLEQEETDIKLISEEQQTIRPEERQIEEPVDISKPADEDLEDILEPLEEDMGDSLEALEEDQKDILMPLEEDLGDILESLEKDQRDILESLEDDQREILESLEDDLGDLLEYLEDDLGDLLKPIQKDQEKQPLENEKLGQDSEKQTNENIDGETEDNSNFIPGEIVGNNSTAFSDEESVTDNILDQISVDNSSGGYEEVDKIVDGELEQEAPKR